MTTHWRKLGCLYCPPTEGRHEKLLTHAANPLPVQIQGDLYRIFYSGRDHRNRSSVGAVDIDIVRREVVNEHHLPCFVHGQPGSYFSDGVSIGGCYEVNGERFMLFMGWQNPADGHWRGDIGRLSVGADLGLTLADEVPLLASDTTDPISLSYPWVLSNPSGGFDMWYGSTLNWDAGNGEMLHVIQHASSSDGHRWQRLGLAVPYQLGCAQAFSRPTVVREGVARLSMWFSYRSGSGQAYRIGRAVSQDDGKTWQLALDRSGLDVSPHGWDSEMIEYPFVFDHAGMRYMLYNGNGYGKTGFGLAVLDEA
ncbi:hypothetical protein J2W49_004535 [Hydrogenophaga palleronii]|uniref:Exo-alpha-sialidase n=1 Tax=Hydrogenophaga palleronii TaxID=65655 RepID=A0ABU1WU85_9BURK|nr:hypothetical protein [Hydrogenophaga palleronii]MDR7152557.1 hypothetical protein [Hydrogenophaga palleronii]